MSQNCEMQVCQRDKVKRIKSYFHELRELWKKVWGTSLLPQVLLISSIKRISSYISKIFRLQSVVQLDGRAVAYAGFSKGGGAGNLKIMKTKKKFLHSESVRFSAQN